MIKSIIGLFASAVSITGYSIVHPLQPLPMQPLPPNCFPFHVRDIPGYSCNVYDPVIGRMVNGPFVPYQPYIENAFYHQQQWNTYSTDYLNNMQSWQLGEFDRYKAFLDASPWPKPYGHDAFFENQKEWIEYHHKMENIHFENVNKEREQFLNWNSPNRNGNQ